MWKIIDRLYLGTGRDAKDLDLLQKKGVSHILNCTGGVVPCSYPDYFQYLQISVHAEQLTDQIDSICSFISQGCGAGKVLVHCSEARERSPAAVIAYLCYEGHPIDEAMGLLRQATSTRAEGFIPPPYALLEPLLKRFDAEQ